uniref:polynucleotide adenylyltransferase n=1 Tax=Globodera rostochiensis TaxID=31243 RepID=A0A914HU85_GLORO
MTNIFDFTDFCNDSTIFEMYKKYILFYFDEKKMEILDIGALINEIEQRIKMISDMGKLEYLNDYLNKNEFKKMMEQIGIDQDLFEKKILKTEQENYLLPTFPLISQQLFVTNSFDVITKSDQYFQNYLTTFLFGDFYKAQKFERKINDGIGTIASIVDKWSNMEARLLASGSLLLYSHTNSSDVNLMCLTPEQTNAAAASSLFCQICAHKSTTNLIKIVSESILLIRFNFDGIEFDISLVAVPSISYLAQQINDNELANLLKRFDWSSNSDQKHMIRSLSSYRSTLYIYNLFNNPMANTDQRSFRHLLLAIRSWAKNNYIYSNKMGFLNGMSLAIMVTKIVLLYPNATLPFLLEKFFLFYSARLVKIPLQLTKIAKDDQDLLSNSSMFSFLKFNEFEMPLITPKFPVQNVARLVTHSNAKVIRLEMIKALRKIKSMKNRAFDLGELMEFIPFTQKYANFIVINCMAEQMDLAYDFCGFVEWRMRLQIIFSIDTKGGSFETHLYPNVYKENCNLPNNFVETSFRANYCKIWILGITNSISNNSMSENLSSMAQQFDLAIKRDYLNKNKGTAPNHWLTIDDFYKTMKMELKSIVTKSEMIRGF